MIRKPKSTLASSIDGFLNFKRRLGYKYSTKEYILLEIDDLALQLYLAGPGLTREFSEVWTKRRLNETYGTNYNRSSLLRQFAHYLVDNDIETHIPQLPLYRPNEFIPHIFSKQELDAIFNACDKMTVKSMRFSSSLFAIPALLRTLYATGIRIGEALSLKMNDVSLQYKYLKVRDSKNGKERIIPISVSLTSILNQYLYYRKQLPFRHTENLYFFVRKDGKKLSYPAVTARFKDCLSIASIPFIGNHQGPRLHDLRHTFAVNSLAKMCSEGIDIYVSLPILSTYLGHTSIESTNHYVRLTAAMYPEVVEKFDLIQFDTFPKFIFHETN